MTCQNLFLHTTKKLVDFLLIRSEVNRSSSNCIHVISPRLSGIFWILTLSKHAPLVHIYHVYETNVHYLSKLWFKMMFIILKFLNVYWPLIKLFKLWTIVTSWPWRYDITLLKHIPYYINKKWSFFRQATNFVHNVVLS